MSESGLVVFPQLQWRRDFAKADSSLEGSRNCACAVGAGIVAWATRGVDKPSHHEFRLQAGNPNVNGKPTGLSSKQVLAGYRLWKLDVTRHFGGSFELVRDALQAGHAVSLCIDYKFINDNARDELSGQHTFMTGHHVALLGWTPKDPLAGGDNSTVVHDPLFDGRIKPWGQAPLGPQRAPFRIYRGAMGALRVNGPTYSQGTPIGKDLGVFLIVKRNPPLANEFAAIGAPSDVAQLTAAKAELEVKLQEAQAQIDRLRDHIKRADAELDEAL